MLGPGIPTGANRAARPDAGAKSDASYTTFTTERPTFANDNLYGALEKSGTTVRATPVVQERGAPWNLLISFWCWSGSTCGCSGGSNGPPPGEA